MAQFAPLTAVIAVALIAAAPTAVTQPAAKVTRAHAIAMHGEPKYGPDFRHFDYVNPDAPKGGTVRLGVQGTYDSFNPYIAKGVAGAGNATETLMVAGADEPFSQYGLIAESIEYPDDRSWATFTLRSEARWHDGRPITVEDVIYSLGILKTQGHPFYRFYYANIVKAEKVGSRQVKFTFAQSKNRELPLIAGELPVLPRHYWQDRDFANTTLDPPLGSGPYRIVDFEAGRHVTVERVKDYWGANLAVNRGQYNFDRIRYDYYRDDTVLRQALKAGKIDWREENQAKAWALDYGVPAASDGRLKLVEIPNRTPTGMQAFAMNTRRDVFKDRRVRQALAYAFDFEWSNRNLFFGQYARTESYFSNSELASSGVPEGDELKILEHYRGRVPDEIFTRAYRPPATDGSGWPRDNLRTAFKLLAEAGWVVRDMTLVNEKTGEAMSFEILLVSQAFERIVLPFRRNLARLGIDVRVRLVDQSQYVNRLRSFDYDMIIATWGESESPGNEQRSYWISEAADSPAARNYAGIKDAVVDELVEGVISAADRPSLIARTRALDRVLLWGHYVIPQWHLTIDRIAHWDKFGRPTMVPRRGTQLDYWWIDPVKEKRLIEGRPDAAAESSGGAHTPGGAG